MFWDDHGNEYASRFCVHPLTPDGEIWLNTLREKPNCEVTRMVYADWLIEHGEQEEADRQLAYLAAMRWMTDFAGKLGEHCTNYDDIWLQDIGVRPQIEEVYEEITAEQAIQAGWDAAKHDRFFTQMGQETAREVMYREGMKEAYWKNWQIITGEKVNEETREHHVFSCSC